MTALAGTTTNALTEGSNNLYFTNARADGRFVTDLAATTSVKSITTLPGLSLPYSQVTGAPGVFGKSWEIISGVLVPTTTVPVSIPSTFLVTGTSTLATTTTASINGLIVVDGVHYPQNDVGIFNALAVASSTNQCVYLPAGTYLMTANHTSARDHYCLLGAGEGNTVLKLQGSSIKGLDWGVAGTPVHDGAYIANLTVDMNNQASGWGISLSQIKNVTLDRVNVINPSNNSYAELFLGQFTVQPYSWPVENINLLNSTFDSGYNLNSWEAVTLGYINGVYISRTTFEHKLGPTPCVLNYGSRNVRFVDDTIDHCFASTGGLGPIDFTGTNFIDAYALLWNSDNTTFTGGGFYSYEGSTTGISMRGSYEPDATGESPWYRWFELPYHYENRNVVVNGVTFYATTTGQQGYFISSYKTTDGGVDNLSTRDLTISNSTFENACLQSVWVWARTLHVSGNTFRNSNACGIPATTQLAVGSESGDVGGNIFIDDKNRVNTDMSVDENSLPNLLTKNDIRIHDNQFNESSPIYYWDGAPKSTITVSTTTTEVFNNASTTSSLIGNLGIGTTTPFYPLSVNGKIYSATGGFVFPDGSTQTTAAISLSNTLANGLTGTTTFFNRGIVYSDGTKLTQKDGFVFNPNGVAGFSVGIGTSTPDAMLTIQGQTFGGGPLLHVGDSTTNQGNQVLIENRWAGAGGYGLLVQRNASTPQFIVDGNGNVGVATSTPGTLFSIGNTGGISFTLATTTFNTTGGLNLSAGCFAISGNCLSLSTLSGSIDLTSKVTGTLPVGNGGTGQSSISSSKLVYGAGSGALQSVATSSATCSGGLSCSAFTVVGSVAPAITLSTPVSIANGGTGTTTQITNGILLDMGGLLTSTTSLVWTGQTLNINPPAGGDAIKFQNSNWNEGGSNGSWTMRSGFSGKFLSFQDSGSNNKDVFTMDTGALGIGGNIATYPLDVTGAGHFTTYVDARNFIATSTSISNIFMGSTGIGTSSPFAKLSIQANAIDTNQVLFAIGSSTATATTTLFKIDNQGNITQSGPSEGSATKGTCFAAKNANANSLTYWYFPTAGAAPTYQTTDCGGAGTTTITYH